MPWASVLTLVWDWVAVLVNTTSKPTAGSPAEDFVPGVTGAGTSLAGRFTVRATSTRVGLLSLLQPAKMSSGSRSRVNTFFFI